MSRDGEYSWHRLFLRPPLPRPFWLQHPRWRWPIRAATGAVPIPLATGRKATFVDPVTMIGVGEVGAAMTTGPAAMAVGGIATMTTMATHVGAVAALIRIATAVRTESMSAADATTEVGTNSA